MNPSPTFPQTTMATTKPSRLPKHADRAAPPSASALVSHIPIAARAEPWWSSASTTGMPGTARSSSAGGSVRLANAMLPCGALIVLRNLRYLGLKLILISDFSQKLTDLGVGAGGLINLILSCVCNCNQSIRPKFLWPPQRSFFLIFYSIFIVGRFKNK
jgi:hypothetical protein